MYGIVWNFRVLGWNAIYLLAVVFDVLLSLWNSMQGLRESK